MSHGSCNESALREESLFHFLFLDFTFLGDRDFKMDKWNMIIYIYIYIKVVTVIILIKDVKRQNYPHLYRTTNSRIKGEWKVFLK